MVSVKIAPTQLSPNFDDAGARNAVNRSRPERFRSTLTPSLETKMNLRRNPNSACSLGTRAFLSWIKLWLEGR